MYKILYLLCIYAQSICAYEALCTIKSQNTQCVTPALLKLLDKLDVKHQGTLESIVEVTQKELLRKSTTERWEIGISEKDTHLKDILPFFKDFGMVEAKKPTLKKYHYAVILGSTFSSVLKRLSFLEQQWREGIRFDKIIILGGERQLTSVEKEELKSHGYSSINDERDMLEIACKLGLTDKKIKKLPLKLIKASKKPHALRATTSDTVQAWLETQPEPGTALVVSTQPHILYQEAVLKRLLPETFTIEGVGNQAKPDLLLGIYTDALARFLYECLEITKKRTEATCTFEKGVSNQVLITKAL